MASAIRRSLRGKLRSKVCDKDEDPLRPWCRARARKVHPAFSRAALMSAGCQSVGLGFFSVSVAIFRYVWWLCDGCYYTAQLCCGQHFVSHFLRIPMVVRVQKSICMIILFKNNNLMCFDASATVALSASHFRSGSAT